MSRPRFQFRLSTLLWITLAVACWFGGTEWGWRRNEPTTFRSMTMGDDPDYLAVDVLVRRDGTRWFRAVVEGQPIGVMTFANDQGAEIAIQVPSDATRPEPEQGKRESPLWIYEERKGRIIRRATDEKAPDGTWRPVE
jgi:hypothetical protein